jgi:zona occludens toxin (predicted ATPase)
MIICFMGTPGSGKTYEAVKKVLDNVRVNRVVYTNIDGFDNVKCREYQKAYLSCSDFDYETSVHYLSKADVVHFWDIVPSGSLVVIDEAHKYFGNRDWKSEENKGFSLWATDHRHLGCDCVLMTHDIEKIDKHVRSCVEWTYEFKKINFVGSLVRNSYLWYAYNSDDVTGKPLKWGRRTYDKYLFNCYQSYMAKDIKELKIMSHANILRHPLFYSIPLIIAFAIYMFSRSGFAKGQILGVPVVPATSSAKVIASLPVVTPKKLVPSVVAAPPLKIYGLTPAPVTQPQLVTSPVALSNTPVPCEWYTTLTVVMPGHVIVVRRCGCHQIKLDNDKVVEDKVLSKDRCGKSEAV